MILKRTIPVFLIFIASIALGVYYNTYLIELPYFSHSSMLSRFFTNILITLFLVIHAGFFHYVFKDALCKYKDKFSLVMGYMCLITIILYILQSRHYGVNHINTLTIIYIYPFVFSAITDQFYKKHGLIYSFIMFCALMAICWFVSDLKMIFFSAIMFVFAECIAVKMIKPLKRKPWYWHVGILSIVIITSFAVTLFLNWDIFCRRIAGFFTPTEVLEYRLLLEWLGNCELISYNPNKLFISDINSMTACPYAHIMTCFGILPSLVIVGLQMFMVFLIFKNSTKFVDTRRRYLGVLSSVMISLHLTLSLLSSFYVIPMVEYGGPFILSNGFAYSYIPTLLYFYLEFIEYYTFRKKTIKKFRRYRNT